MTYERTASVTAELDIEAAELFSYLDDALAVGNHMQERSMIMLGARMEYVLDPSRGREVGSIIEMKGSVLGQPLYVREVLTDRVVPRLKYWETSGNVRLIVIDRYRMGFSIEPERAGCRLTARIDYDLP